MSVLPESAARSRMWYLLAVIAVVAAGLASRRFPGLLLAFLGKYPGDALWALMVFLGWGIALPRTSSIRIGLYALCTSYLVEFSQLYQALWINSIRSTTVGHLVLGSGFSWPDLVAYAFGVLIGVLGERIARICKPRHSAPNS